MLSRLMNQILDEISVSGYLLLICFLSQRLIGSLSDIDCSSYPSLSPLMVINDYDLRYRRNLP